jgi:hypothetical protein
MRGLIVLGAWGAFAVAPIGAQTTAPPPATDINSKLVNAPTVAWSIYGPGQTNSYDDKGGPQGYPVTRVTVTAIGKNAWDAGAIAPLTKPVQAGDVIFVAMFLRAPMLKDGETAALPFIGVTGAQPPYENLATGSATIGNQWKQYFAVGKAPHGFAAGGAQAAVHLAGAKGVVDLGPIRVFDLGLDVDPATLPHN